MTKLEFYQKIYDNLIEKRRNKPINIKEYKQSFPDEPSPERHHIIPKSIGGNNSPDNIILLTCREHFIAHKLLVKIAENKNDKNMYIKMIHSLLCFYNLQQKNSKYIIRNSRDYQNIKGINSRIGVSNEQREKMRNAWKIRKLKPESTETRIKKSESHKGLKHNEETKNKMSKAQYNRWKSIELREKQSKTLKLKYLNLEERQKLSYRMKNYWKKLSNEDREKRSNSFRGEKNPMYGKKYIRLYNAKLNKMIMISENDKDKIDKFISEGFIKGGYPSAFKGKKLNKIWVSNEILKKSKLILKEELSDYLAKGYKKGRKIKF